MEYVRITDRLEMMAVMNGEIEGDVYRDGEVWADPISLLQWRAAQPIEAHPAAA
jgi:hypothetical protein